MKTFLCVVSPERPENYRKGLLAKTWGVQEVYEQRIRRTCEGDELVFIADQKIRSIHRIDSPVYRSTERIWEPVKGDFFPWRIKISDPLFRGEIQKEVFRVRIGFMSEYDNWGLSIRGVNGVFNDRLSLADVAFIKGRLTAVGPPNPQPGIVAEAAQPTLPEGRSEAPLPDELSKWLRESGLKVMRDGTGAVLAEESGGGMVLSCKHDWRPGYAVVYFRKGVAAPVALAAVIQRLESIEQSVAAGEVVKGFLLASSVDPTLQQILRVTPGIVHAALPDTSRGVADNEPLI